MVMMNGSNLDKRSRDRIDGAIKSGRLARSMEPDARAAAIAVAGDEARLDRWLANAEHESHANVSRRLGVSTQAIELAEQVSHYTADGKVVLKDGRVMSRKKVAETIGLSAGDDRTEQT